MAKWEPLSVGEVRPARNPAAQAEGCGEPK